MQTPPNQQTVIIVSEYPSVGSTVKELLNQNNYKTYQTSTDLLFKNRPPADLVLFCPMPPAEICEKSLVLYPGKIAMFVFGYGEKKRLPTHLQEKIHLITLDQHLPQVLESIQLLTKEDDAPTVIIDSKYPIVRDETRKLLNQNNFKTYQTSTGFLLNNSLKADLILLCPLPPLEVCIKLVVRYPGKISIFIFDELEKQELPTYLQDKIHFISLKNDLPEIAESIKKLVMQNENE